MVLGDFFVNSLCWSKYLRVSNSRRWLSATLRDASRGLGAGALGARLFYHNWFQHGLWTVKVAARGLNIPDADVPCGAQPPTRESIRSRPMGTISLLAISLRSRRSLSPRSVA